MIKFITSTLLYLFLAASALAQNPAPVKLAWMHSTDNVAVTGYNIYRDGKKIGSSPTTSYTDATVAPTTQYSYTISAFDAAGNESDMSLPYVIKTGTIIILPPGGDHAFSLPTGSVLHFIAPVSLGGDDTNDGLAPTVGGGHGPWKTTNHTMKCGEVILASPGTYATYPDAPFFGTNLTPTNCPSTSGGIDGTGGIWFAIVLCAGSDIGATNGCVLPGIGNQAGYGSVEFSEGQSNWAFSGFYFDTGCVNTSVPGTCSRSFQSRFCNAGSQNHHLALINSITTNSMQGWAFNGCGNRLQTPDNFTDYVASIGVITHNSNQNGDYQGGFCVGSIDFVELGNWDTNPGTHAYIYNNYGINNQSPACAGNGTGGSGFDGEAFYIDSPDAHAFTQQAVIANNIGYLSTRECVAVTYHGYSTPSGALFKIYNNTCFNNDVAPNATELSVMQIELDSGCTLNAPYDYSVTNNISYIDHARALTVHQPWLYVAGTCGSITGAVTFGSVGSENVFKSSTGQVPTCPSSGGNAQVGNSTCDVFWANNTVPTLTNNFFVNPTFADTVDLLANRTTVPNCTGFDNTTACLGWNASMGSLTVPSVISDLTANCGSNCTGKGFQRPSTVCAANADYPTWLKGINYLKASGYTAGATITEKAGLATKPCGL